MVSLHAHSRPYLASTWKSSSFGAFRVTCSCPTATWQNESVRVEGDLERGPFLSFSQQREKKRSKTCKHRKQKIKILKTLENGSGVFIKLYVKRWTGNSTVLFQFTLLFSEISCFDVRGNIQPCDWPDYQCPFKPRRARAKMQIVQPIKTRNFAR